MSKHHDDDEEDYGDALRDLQIELVKLQRDLIADKKRVLIILEGRDTAGKDGTIKRLTEHMAPRETRVHAPSIPSSREETEWYFQRFVPYLPAAGEFVIFNRSWYNRAGVEPVMGYCTEDEARHFLHAVVPFEHMLVQDGIALRKYYLDISKKEQKKRLADRHKDPLKQWKISPVDEAASSKWHAYSKARDRMFAHTSHPSAPWHVVKADEKKPARLNLLKDLLEGFSYPGKKGKLTKPDREIVFAWEADLESDRIAK